MVATKPVTPSASSVQPGLVDALVRLSHAVQCVFGDVSRERDLTPQQAQLLCVLTIGPVGLTELSQTLHLERSSLTGLIDRVERRDLVVRHRDSRDRRACHVTLTDAGSRLAHDVHAEVCARLERLAETLLDGEREGLTRSAAELVGQYHSTNLGRRP